MFRRERFKFLSKLLTWGNLFLQFFSSPSPALLHRDSLVTYYYYYATHSGKLEFDSILGLVVCIFARFCPDEFFCRKVDISK